ncbi:MAG: alpha/beta hydrolase family protein [Betaproteobacteria bacterium]|jgi:pimeloyl-ACP methyl ester carboxylesterase|nr:esterase FrsA [Betaproteobacteria bacterium]
MWYLPISDSEFALGRTLAQLKAELLRRTEYDLMPVAGVPLDDTRAVLARVDTLARDAWAQAWAARAEIHLERADAMRECDPAAACEAYRLAWRLFHFARWPVENTPFKRHVYPRALAAFRNHGRLLDPPLEMLRIPFRNETITAYLRMPRAADPLPLVIGISGLDSRKEDVMALAGAYLRRGIALIAVDMPGTGEAPATLAPDAVEMFSALLDWVAGRDELDAGRVVVQGRSWSGYWGARLAIVERERLRGAVMHGGPIHHYFQPQWLGPSLQSHEYLYDYLPATAALFGVDGLEALLAAAPAHSLQAQGLLGQPAAPLLLINGARDSQIPITDVELLAGLYPQSTVWINPQGGHMGRSADWSGRRIFEEVTAPWLERVLQLSAACG